QFLYWRATMPVSARPCTWQARLTAALALVAAAWPAPAPAQVIYTIRNLGTLGGPSSRGDAVNAAGQVVGSTDIVPGSSSPYHAFRTTATGQMIDLGVGVGSSEGTAINAAGQVAGYAFYVPSDLHAFRVAANGLITDPGTDLGTLPGGTASRGSGIN